MTPGCNRMWTSSDVMNCMIGVLALLVAGRLFRDHPEQGFCDALPLLLVIMHDTRSVMMIRRPS
jgi:hypothetical protein